MEFLTAIAWVFGIYNTILTVGRIIVGATYSDLERQLDGLRGQRVAFPITISGTIAIVCWCYILTK